MSLYPRRPPPPPPRGKTEFEILKSAHKFLRQDDEADARPTWDDQLARKYYDSLYKEYALCDLKHYKSGNFALRWRTEKEVLSGSGEETCGNTRCSHHDRSDDRVALTPVELPFNYAEDGQMKSALVKVVLCAKCLDKLMYKHRKEKGKDKATTCVSGKDKQIKVEDVEHDDVQLDVRSGRAAPRRMSQHHAEEDLHEGGPRPGRTRRPPRLSSSPSPPRHRSRDRIRSSSSQRRQGSHHSHSRARTTRHSRSRSPRSTQAEPTPRRW
ncbi:folate-sensitive fragile site protein Fra10Ac1-domain-containing protein [Schizophyllum amplum]|uniref:Folate-sensitive fragile site protein Fra10Ac1-domain-containing protein n=1 Tax=Schizophyllum amplum TaxID=97359 RepID=A0A550CI88_9AGAR|nr:folate-sensitive fragile site protein Fra10Ac1-domain-containing protein [Auriculariopsis ampla]